MKHSAESDLLTDLVLEIFRVNAALIGSGDQLVNDLGLTSARWKVLGALALSGNAMTVAQIAKMMGQTRQGVQRLADLMAQDGLIVYRDNPLHKKAKLAELTPRGRKLYAQADNRQVPWAENLAEGLSQADLRNALDILRKIYKRLDNKK